MTKQKLNTKKLINIARHIKEDTEWESNPYKSNVVYYLNRLINHLITKNEREKNNE